MGTSSTGGGGASGQAEFTQPTAPGILVSLACFALEPHPLAFQTYAQIGIKTDIGALDGRRIQLASGYIREEEGITWTGFYPIHDGDLIYMFLRGNLDPLIQLVERKLTADTTIIPGITLAKLLTAIK
jgi:hypothetical protein